MTNRGIKHHEQRIESVIPVRSHHARCRAQQEQRPLAKVDLINMILMTARLQTPAHMSQDARSSPSSPWPRQTGRHPASKPGDCALMSKDTTPYQTAAHISLTARWTDEMSAQHRQPDNPLNQPHSIFPKRCCDNENAPKQPNWRSTPNLRCTPESRFGLHIDP